jgi:phage terminase small subunit
MPRGQQPLTPRQEAFCLRIVAGDSLATAARRAGYAAGVASVRANKLMKLGKVITRIDDLKRRAIEKVVTPGADAVVLSRAYLIQRLVDMQHGQRDSVAFNAVVKLGQEEFNMFIDKVAYRDPATESTDDLMKFRAKLRKEQGLGA